jgi:hypothetical protein
VLTQINTAPQASAEAVKDGVSTDGEAAPFALQDLFRLEDGENGVAHHETGEFRRIGRQRPRTAKLVDVRREKLFLYKSAHSHQLQEFVGSGGCGHGTGSEQDEPTPF